MSENGDRPELPEGWEWKAVEQVADCKLGKMLDKQKNTGTPRPYLRNINVQWGRVDLGDVKQMPIEDSEISRFGVAPGDLLMCEGGEPGRCAVWTDGRPMFFQKALHRIRPYEGMLPTYLSYYFEHIAAGGPLDRSFTGTTIKHLPGEKLRQIPIPVPPPAEQDEIVRVIGEMWSRLNAAKLDLARAEAGVPRYQLASVRAVMPQGNLTALEGCQGPSRIPSGGQ